jgi:signal recognition particle receptor subunit beta
VSVTSPDQPGTRAHAAAHRAPESAGAGQPPLAVKIVVAGGFGVGKTTAVTAISDIPPLTTEAQMTSASIGVDDLRNGSPKTSTTVAMDFGCVKLDRSLKLYLFGTPGQERFGFMWDDLTKGAMGAVVIVDSMRLDDCYPSVDYFEKSQLPFIVAVNTFNGVLSHPLKDIRWALAVGDDIPVVAFDARRRTSVRDTLLIMLDRALDMALNPRNQGSHAAGGETPGP